MPKRVRVAGVGSIGIAAALAAAMKVSDREARALNAGYDMPEVQSAVAPIAEQVVLRGAPPKFQQKKFLKGPQRKPKMVRPKGRGR